MEEKDLAPYIDLLNAPSRHEVKKVAREATFTSEGLFGLILAGRADGIRPYLYTCHFIDRVGEHLAPTDEELTALGSSEVGQMKGKALKAAKKISQTFEERKLAAAHLFYTPDFTLWHLFYFDQRDTTDRTNHWKHGPHIHYSSNLIWQGPLSEMWEGVHGSPPKFPKSEHIRYDHRRHRTIPKRGLDPNGA